MADVFIHEQYLTDIADAIRSKLDTEDTYKPSEMAEAIESISGGGSTLGTKTITQNGTYDAEDDSLDGYSEVTVNVSSGGSPVINPLSVTENGTYTAPSGVDGYSPVTVDTTDGGKHLETGDEIVIVMGMAHWEQSKAVCNLTGTNDKIRRSLFALIGESNVYYYTGSGTPPLSDLHLIPIPNGVTSVKLTLDRDAYCAFREFIETNGTITDSIGTTGWEQVTANTPMTVQLNSGTSYISVGIKADSAGNAFTYLTIPRKAVLEFV